MENNFKVEMATADQFGRSFNGISFVVQRWSDNSGAVRFVYRKNKYNRRIYQVPGGLSYI